MKYLLVLGGTSDIGVSIAKEFAAKKWGIILAARSEAKLEVIGKDLEIRYDVPVESYFFDADDFNNHAAFFDKLPNKPEVSCCTFGYLGDQELGQKDWEETNRIITANFTGAVSILNVLANYYESKKQGGIIGISSVAGERGRQSNYLYGSSKAAFTAYLSGLRARLFKSNVHVLTVKPGFVKTKMTAGLPLPAPLTASSEQVGKATYKAYVKKQNVVYVLPVWKYIMKNIKMIPEGIFKRTKL